MAGLAAGLFCPRQFLIWALPDSLPLQWNEPISAILLSFKALLWRYQGY